MKTNIKNFKHIVTVFTAFSIIVACETEGALDFGKGAISIEEVSQNTTIDIISDEVDNIVEDVYYMEQQEGLAGKSESSLKSSETSVLSDCVVVTIEETGTTIKKSLDFGAGCEIFNGNILRGILHLSYEKNLEAAAVTIAVSFENFYVNNVKVSGERMVVRELSNENGNPQATITYNIIITWPSGLSTEREGLKIREWIEGVGNEVWDDNVYVVTGNWTTTFWNGTVHQGEVTVPLRRELSCSSFVSGVLHLQRNDREGNLDFGNGACDNEAVFTYADGTAKVINLN